MCDTCIKNMLSDEAEAGIGLLGRHPCQQVVRLCSALDEAIKAREAAEQTVQEWAYRVGEWESITALLADREEATTYLKVAALEAEAARLRAAAKALTIKWYTLADELDGDADRTTLDDCADELRAVVAQEQP